MDEEKAQGRGGAEDSTFEALERDFQEVDLFCLVIRFGTISPTIISPTLPT